MSNLTRQVLRTLGAILLVSGLLYLLWVVRFTLIYLIISAVIAVMGKPLVDLLSGQTLGKFKLGRGFSSGIVLILLLSIFGGILSFFIPALVEELTVLSNLDFSALYGELQSELNLFKEQFIPNTSNDKVSPIANPQFTEIFNLENVSNTFTGLLGGLGNLVFALFSILFITFFFLKERNLFRNMILAIVPERLEGQILHVSPNLRKTLGRYFTGILIQITIVTAIVSIGLKIGGFNNTIVIGFFAGLINVIPYLGPIIGATFGLIIGLAQVLGGTASLELLPAVGAIVIVFGSMQMVDNFVLQPLIFSRSIKAHPLEIFIVISFAAAIAGIAGMIVAIPVYSVVRLLAAEFFPNVKFVKWLIQSNLNEQDKPV